MFGACASVCMCVQGTCLRSSSLSASLSGLLVSPNHTSKEDAKCFLNLILVVTVLRLNPSRRELNNDYTQPRKVGMFWTEFGCCIAILLCVFRCKTHRRASLHETHRCASVHGFLISRACLAPSGCSCNPLAPAHSPKKFVSLIVTSWPDMASVLIG